MVGQLQQNTSERIKLENIYIYILRESSGCNFCSNVGLLSPHSRVQTILVWFA